MTHIIDEIEEKCKEKGAKLVIVSKTRSLEQMEYYYQRGYRCFGENKVQELLKKLEWHEDVEWHYIGRLQTNKVKDVVRHVSLLHSLNRYELMEAIEKEAAKQNKTLDCLLQFNLADEDTKSGFALNEAEEIVERVHQFPHIHIKGIMCMGPHVEDEKEIVRVFKLAKSLFDNYKSKEAVNFEMQILSMGMSQDYELALEEGSTMLRIGSILFEEG